MRTTSRRGDTAVTVAVSMMTLLGFTGVALEFGFHGIAERQLQLGLDAASHAAMLELDGTAAGVARAVAEGERIAAKHHVLGAPLVLDDTDFVMGRFDKLSRTFVVDPDPVMVNAIHAEHTMTGVTAGLADFVFGSAGMTVEAHGTIAKGPGHATTGAIGGPGLANGHFDVDTVVGSRDCAGSKTCASTTLHTHEYDDLYDVTTVDLLAPKGGHVGIDDCIDSKGKVVPSCSTGTRVIPAAQTFKILVINADLSPGVWLRVNGVNTPVTVWDDQPFSSMPTFALGTVAGATKLTELAVGFDLDAIASCELLPTTTTDVRNNTAGKYGEWRNGALTVQLVKTTATRTAGKSNGDQDVVIHQNNGLLWESTYFWHWDSVSYHKSGWTTRFDQLVCATPVFVD
ncbi:MAG: hypothetical protein ABMB14_08335 [Myxococcota bacterium]